MICAWLFVPRFLPFIWILFGAVEVFCFFYFSSILSNRWSLITQKAFQKKLIATSLAIRTLYVVFIYFFYISKTGNPFEFSAGDSIGYHGTANELLDWFYLGWLNSYFQQVIELKGVSDIGWELTLTFLYILFFRSIFMVRLFNAIISSLMVITIYKISRRNFGEHSARITAIMAMLLPAFIFYSGLHLKETFMIFLLMSFIERADHLIHSRNFSLWNILVIVLLGISLFFFRTVLAVAAWFALFSALLFNTEKLMSKYNRIIVTSWFIISFIFLFSGSISSEVSKYYGKRKTNQEGHLEFLSTRQGANKLAKYGNAALFIPIIIPAPFPTLVNIPEQQNAMMTNGDLFTRNIYVFFVFIAFYTIFKNKLIRDNLLLSIFLASYLLILANSGFALSPRFHLPIIPFLLIFAGYGITKTNRNLSSYYVIYLIVISTIVIAWNWFKLAGRGLV